MNRVYKVYLEDLSSYFTKRYYSFDPTGQGFDSVSQRLRKQPYYVDDEGHDIEGQDTQQKRFMVQQNHPLFQVLAKKFRLSPSAQKYLVREFLNAAKGIHFELGIQLHDLIHAVLDRTFFSKLKKDVSFIRKGGNKFKTAFSADDWIRELIVSYYDSFQALELTVELILKGAFQRKIDQKDISVAEAKKYVKTLASQCKVPLFKKIATRFLKRLNEFEDEAYIDQDRVAYELSLKLQDENVLPVKLSQTIDKMIQAMHDILDKRDKM